MPIISPSLIHQKPHRISKGVSERLLEDENILKVGHHLKRIALAARGQGIGLKGIHFDTMVASYVINPGLKQHDLGHLSQRFFDHKLMSYQEVVGKGKSQIPFSEVALLKAKEYSCELADVSLRLKEKLDETASVRYE